MKPLACSAFLILFGIAAHGQVRETTTVEVVEVPVYVTAKAAPVSALRRENFQLFINGKPQPIEYFDSIDYATLGQSQDFRQRRLYMLVFDLISPANELLRAQKAALQFVDHAGEHDTIGVSTFRSRGGLRIVVPFTRDHAAVGRAIRELDIAEMSDPLHLALTPGERGQGGRWPGRVTDPVVDPNLLDPTTKLTEIARDEVADLTDLADRLAGMEGQKHVVLLSSGFEGHLQREPRVPGDIRYGPIESMQELNRQSTPPPPVSSSALIRELDGLHAAYAAAGVFLDAIDIGGLRYFQTAWNNESLYELVSGTGGQIIKNRNDLFSALRLLTDLNRVVYILGFRTANTGRTENKIRVKLVNVPRGTEAAYRSSYQSIADVPGSDDMLRQADIIQNDIPQNGVTTSVSTEATPNGEKVDVAIPGRELLAQMSGDVAGAKVMLYVMSGTSVVTFRIKRIDVDVPRAGEALRDAPVHVSDTFELPPGNYAAKVLVRMDLNGALGFARADFTIPPAAR